MANGIETHSATWRIVTKWAEAEIAAAQQRLETTGLGLPETEAERGRIAALRDLLGQAQPRPRTAAGAEETYGT